MKSNSSSISRNLLLRLTGILICVFLAYIVAGIIWTGIGERWSVKALDSFRAGDYPLTIRYVRYIDKYNLMEPSDDDMLLYGMSLIYTGKYSDAVQSLQPMNEDDRALNATGVALLFADRPEDALNSFLQAISINPEIGYYHHNLAIAYKKTGNDQKATSSKHKAITLNGEGILKWNAPRLYSPREYYWASPTNSRAAPPLSGSSSARIGTTISLTGGG